jgi:hypothetical protein
MRTEIKIALGIVAATVLVIAGLGAGWLFWGQRLWAPGMMAGPGLSWNSAPCEDENSGWEMMGRGRGWGMMGGGWGSGMMGGGPGWNTSQDCPGPGTIASPTSGTIDIQDAQRAVETYVKDLGYNDLEIAELMEFENNFYAIVYERDGHGGIGTAGRQHQRGRWSRNRAQHDVERTIRDAPAWLDDGRSGERK